MIPDEALGGQRPVVVPVPKGGVLLMTNRTPHASFENKTDIVRWSMDLRYQSAALPTNAQITRLPGEATSVGNVSACLWPAIPPSLTSWCAAGFGPNEVMKTGEQFIALRKNYVEQQATDRWGYSWTVIEELNSHKS